MDDIFHIYLIPWVIKSTSPTLLLHPTRSSLWVWSQYIPCSPLLSSLSSVAFTCHFNYDLTSSCVSYTCGYCLPSPGNTSLICFEVQMKKKKKKKSRLAEGLEREKWRGPRLWPLLKDTYMSLFGYERDKRWDVRGHSDASEHLNTRLFNISMSNFSFSLCLEVSPISFAATRL